MATQAPLARWVRASLWFALMAVTTYVAGWIAAGALRAGYDPRQQAISELFELTAPWTSRGPLVLGLVLSGIAFLMLAPALHHALPGTGRLGPWLVVIAGLGTLGVVAAPCSPGCPGAASSPFDLWHTINAGTGYTALVLAPLAFAWRLRHDEPGLARWSLAIGGSAALLFTAYVLGLVTAMPGLQQRVFNTLADTWYLMVVVWLLRRDTSLRRNEAHHETRRASGAASPMPGGPATPERRGARLVRRSSGEPDSTAPSAEAAPRMIEDHGSCG